MIVGQVNSRFEPVVRLEVVKNEERRFEFEAIVDTGFNGELTLSAEYIEALDAEWLCHDEGELADGSTTLFDVYVVKILWHDKLRLVQAELVNATPLIGMSLLENNDLQISVTPNGRVTIAEDAHGASQV